MDGSRNKLVNDFKRFHFIGVITITKMRLRIRLLLITDVDLNRPC